MKKKNIVMVKFDLSGGAPYAYSQDDLTYLAPKEYCFYSDIKLSTGDIVVVDSSNYFALAEVTKSFETIPKECDEKKMKWVIDKVDVSNWKKRQ